MGQEKNINENENYNQNHNESQVLSTNSLKINSI